MLLSPRCEHSRLRFLRLYGSAKICYGLFHALSVLLDESKALSQFTDFSLLLGLFVVARLGMVQGLPRLVVQAWLLKRVKALKEVGVVIIHS
jgi:hypothetical protein